MSTQNTLIRKEYLLSEDNVQKVERIAQAKGTSTSEIVRQAIQAYEPMFEHDSASLDLMGLVSTELRETIAATTKTNKKVAKALKSLEKAKV